MASFNTAGSLKSVLHLLLFLLLLVAVCPVPISTSHTKRPHRFTFYVQETPSTVTFLTNSTLGSFSVLDSPLITEGVLPTSNVIGTEHGFLAQIGRTREAVYAGFEFNIDQSDKYRGTFLVQGVFNFNNRVRTLAIVGGTGLARGHVTFTTAAGNQVPGTANSLKYVANFEY